MDEAKGGARILVVVPDEPIRQSLLFVLGTEGYSFAVFDQLETPVAADAKPGFDCAIVDEDAFGPVPGGWNRLGDAGLPLVLLVDRLENDVPGGVHAVHKPLLGSALVEAVRRALCEGRRRTKGATT